MVRKHDEAGQRRAGMGSGLMTCAILAASFMLAFILPFAGAAVPAQAQAEWWEQVPGFGPPQFERREQRRRAARQRQEDRRDDSATSGRMPRRG